MNTTVQPNENDNSQNVEIEEVGEIAEDASPEEKDAFVQKILGQNRQLYARTKKAEGFEMRDGKWVKPEAAPAPKPKAAIEDTSKFSQSDIIAIVKADVPDEDMGEVLEYAQLKRISIKDALNSSIVKGILAEKSEQRRVAEGTSTGTTKRGNSRVSDEALLENAKKGNMPENDADLDRLVKLQIQGSRK